MERSKIEIVIVTNSKDIKSKLVGDFMEQTFYFKKSDYCNIIDMLEENLPKHAKLKIK